MITGCYTAIITPFNNNGIDYEGLERLTQFQIQNGISGILAVGTTGESPTLAWDEHHQVIKTIAAVTLKSQSTGQSSLCIAGTGSNNTRESLAATEHAAKAGVDAVLLVDPYYNGPSSLEIRREYVTPVAENFPELQIIPYVIPGRTGAQLLPEDLAILAKQYTNVQTVKEATADIDNMRRTRALCGAEYSILSGDDAMTFEMMTDPKIMASGVISVISNIAPRAVSDMVKSLEAQDISTAEALFQSLKPLFNLVTVKTIEMTDFGQVQCRARNPLAIKTLMAILGMPSGGCRAPMGKMTPNGINIVLEAARATFANNPEILEPSASFFDIDIEGRLNDTGILKELTYSSY